MLCMSYSISIVSGTRPEVVKLATVYKTFKSIKCFNTQWISSGQHREMLEQSLNVFGIKPNINLDLMLNDQTPFDIVSQTSKSLYKIWEEQRPDIVIVQGDTATAFAAAMAAFYLKVPVAHVEAGLRSYSIDEPFPEESHRRMITSMASLHFAPTAISANCLYKEGIDKESIFIVGNTVVDALMSIREDNNFSPSPNISRSKRWVTVTAHRRENHGKELENICLSLLDIRDNIDDVEIIFPVHLNPNVQKTVNKILSKQDRIHLLPAMDYFNFMQLIRNSYLILTDSGGIQEEAPSYRVPVLVLRNRTERPEVINCGMAKLVGSDRNKISEAAINLLNDSRQYELMTTGESPFGDGNSSNYIAKHVLDYLSHRGT